MARKTIAVDLDEVLSAQNEAVRLFANKHYGHNHTPEDYLTEGEYWGYWEVIWGVGKEEGLKRVAHFLDSGGLKGQKPIPGAIDAIKKLETKFNLVIVTSREDKYMDITHKWLSEHFPDVFDHVRFTSMWGQKASAAKAKIVKEIKTSYLIDDNVGHCNSVAKEDIKALLFGDYGWNRKAKLHPEVTRVRGWKEVLEYFDGQK